MSSVVISGDTSGSITLSAPAVAGTNTITLPASTGTVLTTGSPQSGGVIQVVSTTSTSTYSTTSTSFVDTGFSLSITPKLSTSKVLMIVTINGITKPSVASEAPSFQMLRGGVTMSGTTNIMYSTTAMGFVCSASFSYFDSPATTSSTNYKLQFRSRLGNTISLNSDGAGDYSTITLLEIAA